MFVTMKSQTKNRCLCSHHILTGGCHTSRLRVVPRQLASTFRTQWYSLKSSRLGWLWNAGHYVKLSHSCCETLAPDAVQPVSRSIRGLSSITPPSSAVILYFPPPAPLPPRRLIDRWQWHQSITRPPCLLMNGVHFCSRLNGFSSSSSIVKQYYSCQNVGQIFKRKQIFIFGSCNSLYGYLLQRLSALLQSGYSKLQHFYPALYWYVNWCITQSIWVWAYSMACWQSYRKTSF
jgi:hypothetical protein